MNRAPVSITSIWVALLVAGCGSTSNTNLQTSQQGGGVAQTGGSPAGTSGGTNAGSTGGSDSGALGGSSAGLVGGASSGAGGSNAGTVGGTNAVATGGSNVGTVGGTNTVATGGSNAGTVGGTNASTTGGTNAGTTGGSSTGGSKNTGSGGTTTGVAGGSSTGGTGGSSTTTTPTTNEPQLITSEKGAYWKEGTLTELTSGTADVTVNDSTTYQTWDGFGGTFNEKGWDVLSLLDASERERAMKLLFDAQDGARFAYGRVPIGATDYAKTRYTLDETADDTAMTDFSIEHDRLLLIPYIKAALAVKSDVHLWASPWTPPAWMKSNKAIDGGSMVDSDSNLKAFALYLAKFVEEYGKEGLKIEAVHPQNEPGYETRYPSCLWTAALFTKFIRDYMGPTFESRSVTADIWLGTMSNNDAGMDGTIISTVTGDAAAMKYVKGFGLQWNMLGSVSGLQSRNLPIMQTEHKCGNYPWATDGSFQTETAPNDHSYAVESWGLILDWVIKGVNSYSAWNMVLDTDGKNNDPQRAWPQNALLTVDTAAKKLIVTPAYYVFRHVSQYVDPGAKRIGTTGSFTNLLAFKNPDGTIVAVLYNSGTARKMTVAVGSTKLQFDMPADGWATVNW